MKPIKLSFALALVLAAMPLVSFAQEATAEAPAAEEESDFPLSATFAVTSDYVFRGVSQTGGDPAFQAGLTYSAPFGLYVGAWGSNVDFEVDDRAAGYRGPNFEWDYFVGWNKDLSDSWNLDLGATRYTYTGATSGDSDYNEYIAKLTWSGPVTVGGILAYANDYGNVDAEETYAGLTASYDIGETGFSLGASTGYTSIEADDDGGRADYFDGSVSVSKAFGPATAMLGYYDTFGSDADELKDAPGDFYEDRVALTITIAVP